MKSLCSFFVMLFLSACLYVETFLGLIRNKLRGYLFTGGRKVKRGKLTGLVIVQLIIGTLVLFGSIYCYRKLQLTTACIYPFKCMVNYYWGEGI